MLILIIDAEEHMFGCEEEELAQLRMDGGKEGGSALEVRSVLSRDGDTKRSQKGLLNLDSGIEGDNWLVQFRRERND
jgi:hypothetical protein